jgi:hypothetical protein
LFAQIVRRPRSLSRRTRRPQSLASKARRAVSSPTKRNPSATQIKRTQQTPPTTAQPLRFFFGGVESASSGAGSAPDVGETSSPSASASAGTSAADFQVSPSFETCVDAPISPRRAASIKSANVDASLAAPCAFCQNQFFILFSLIVKLPISAADANVPFRSSRSSLKSLKSNASTATFRRLSFLFIAPTFASQVAPPISAGVFPKKSENVVKTNVSRNLAAPFKFYRVSLFFFVSLFLFRCAVRRLAVGAFVLALIYISPATAKSDKKPPISPQNQKCRAAFPFRRRFANAPPPRPSPIDRRLRNAAFSPRLARREKSAKIKEI